MSQQRIFDAVLPALFIVNGLLQLHRARLGFWPRQEFITLGRNPLQPETMTPRAPRSARAVAFAFLVFGTFGFVLLSRFPRA
jgi:hypothetical protein